MNHLNKDTIKGNLTELSGKAKAYWSKLTDNDFAEFKGNLDEMKGKIQKVYGYSKEELEVELGKFKQTLAKKANSTVERVNKKMDEKIERNDSSARH